MITFIANITDGRNHGKMIIPNVFFVGKEIFMMMWTIPMVSGLCILVLYIYIKINAMKNL